MYSPTVAVQTVAAHVDFRLMRQLQIVKSFQRSVGFALVDGGEPGTHRRGQLKRNIRHSERRKNPLRHYLAEALAADALDNLAAPIDVAAIFPFVAGSKISGVISDAFEQVITLGWPCSCANRR